MEEVLEIKQMKLVPKLRFEGFDEVWKKEKSGEICDCIVPGRNKPKHFGGDIAWITTPDIIHNSYIITSKSGLGISKEEAKNVGSKIVPKNSVIISCVGDLGLVAIAGNELVINQQLHAFLPSDNVEYRFLMYSITTQGRYMDRVATKTAVPYMNKDNCNSIPVYLPSLPEQKKIADFLSAVDKKIEQLTRKKELLEQYKKGVMQKLFPSTAGQAPEIRFKPVPGVVSGDDNGNDFPEWEEKRLGDVLKYYDGTHQTPKYVENGIPFYSVEHVTANQFNDTKFISEEVFEQENKRVRLEKGDILMTRIGDIGTSRLINWDVKASFYVSLALLKQNENFDSSFLNQYISSVEFQRELWKRTIHVAFPKKINLGEIGNCLVRLPEIKEQKKIAQYLSAIDEKIEMVANQITQTQTFKKGLLQLMFV